MTGTSTYTNKLLTPSQTELISLLGQLEASSSCWGEEEENSSRTTVETEKQEQGSSGKAAQGCLVWVPVCCALPCQCVPGLLCFRKHPAVPVWVSLCRGVRH